MISKSHRWHSYFRRFFHSAVTGQFLCALGIVLTLQANIGVSPWSVLKQGMTIQLGISFGTADVLTNLAVIICAVMLGEQIGFGSLFCVFLPGPVIDLFQYFGWIPSQDSLLGGLIMTASGIFLLALSTLVYMREELGSGPRDALMVALSKKSGKSAGCCRVCLDFTALAVGWLMGGTVGLGTLMSMFGMGMCIDLVFRAAKCSPKDLRQEHLRETVSRMQTELI